jgi:predicted transcriptional regulator
VQELGLAQATISQHLRELRDAGLIQGTIEGVSICYCIAPRQWSYLRSRFESLFKTLKTAAGDCC